jgi:MFS family permease
MVLLGLGAGIAFNPVLMAAMGDVQPHESGIASGIVNTSFMMGGALGLAVLASLAGAQGERLAAGGVGAAAALHGGYQLAFWIGALFALLAAGIGALGLKPREAASGAAAAAAH